MIQRFPLLELRVTPAKKPEKKYEWSEVKSRVETWVLGLGGYGATVPDKLGGALGSPDENYRITIKLITIKLYF